MWYTPTNIIFPPAFSLFFDTRWANLAWIRAHRPEKVVIEAGLPFTGNETIDNDSLAFGYSLSFDLHQGTGRASG